MTVLSEVNEGTTAYLTVTFLDEDGLAAMPTAATWQCHDVASDTELQAETALTPASSIKITIPASVNTLVNPHAIQEKHRITLVATYGGDDQVTAEYDFVVIGLQWVG
ncbi:MAG: hypothetical protein JXR84_15680 [Anaerolineae bacterium]|nr:hypothetical protein [Anaerolineae bacterium]